MEKEMKKVPAVRFKGFTGDWEQRKFSEIAQRESNMQLSSSDLPSVEYEDVVAEEGILNKNINSKGTQKKGVIFDGNQILYGKLRPYLHNWLNPDFKGIAVGDWWVLKPIETDKNFLYRLIQTPKFDDVANQSSGSKMPRADWNLVANTTFMIPSSITEQKEIGTYFNNIDNLITLHQRKSDQLKKLKAYFLQNLFPAKGEKVPKIRFKGFTGEWEEHKLFDCISKITDFRGRTPKKLGMDWSKEGHIALSALNVKNGYIDFSQDVHYGDDFLYEKWMKGNELHKGQVLFTTEAPMGNVAQVPDDRQYILSQRTIAFTVNKNIILENFLATVLRSSQVQKRLDELQSGGTAKGVSQKSLSSVEIIIPKQIKEQTVISTFFSDIDRNITLHQQKITQLQAVKKFLLQNLFV